MKSSRTKTEVCSFRLKKVKIYLCTKFRWETSIHGRDITTSGFWKRTAAILQFYFRFWLSPVYRHRHVILHHPTKFHPNRTSRGEVLSTYRFFFSGINLHPISINISRSTGQIFAVDSGVSLFNALFRGEPLRIAKFGPKILDASFYMVWCKAFFDIVNCLGVTHECNKQTDRRTGRHPRRKCCAYATKSRAHFYIPVPINKHI